ncbi:hypothetical protein TBLA_0B01100 [Henningerozyma blattae CBS 6284]|uniref:CAP-Gly domain-containing protein n=1 Tax=Henningerozyma blattae (strain ATCC 34711 / CBS 6284 / DSM 70876 / NBRC 10599 / NRRL Y-10934 / UCD 77-7) TaxID=1071380 RepID=I2GXV1_HENB6|nr:hypothetical protein TBLA_0B01100 [Tetrapisispora blattae CBS 6284]CCH58953.1 hypothetical protein TBLA_0B01100 [Tetrapisispora blattae CBS 6284]
MSISVEIKSDFSSIVKDFSKNLTLLELSNKLYPITGVSPSDMALSLYSGSELLGKYENILNNSEKLPLIDINYSSIKVIVFDLNSNSITNQIKKLQNEDEFENNDKFKSFEISEEEYSSRKDTVLQWKKIINWGDLTQNIKKNKKDQELNNLKVNSLQLNERCSIKADGQLERRGILRYIGKVPDINPTDIWCGIEFDEPVGKNNGTFKGITYFGPVNKNYGGFVKPKNVETGKQFVPELSELCFSDDDEL